MRGAIRKDRPYRDGYNLDNLGRTVHDQHRRPGRVSVGALCERTYTRCFIRELLLIVSQCLLNS